MKRFLMTAIASVALGLLPATANADDGQRGLVLRIDGDITLARGEVAGSVVVIGGDAVIEGTVRNNLLVIDGRAVIRGNVEGNATVVSGELELTSSATVENVNLIDSKLTRAAGATVTGDIKERERFVFRGFPAVFGILFWLMMTVSVLASGLVFAAIGGRQLTASAQALTAELGNSILGAVIVWVGLPILATLIILTLVGIPLGVGTLLFLLPALWFLGYITAATRLGLALTGTLKREPAEHPYLAVTLGLLVLQFLVLIPAFGWLVASVAGLWGAGGLALVAFRAARNQSATPPAASAPAV